SQANNKLTTSIYKKIICLFELQHSTFNLLHLLFLANPSIIDLEIIYGKRRWQTWFYTWNWKENTWQRFTIEDASQFNVCGFLVLDMGQPAANQSTTTSNSFSMAFSIFDPQTFYQIVKEGNDFNLSHLKF
ncbi:hypothetical protein BLOT_012713, partial [Blomia tropicalis]